MRKGPSTFTLHSTSAQESFREGQVAFTPLPLAKPPTPIYPECVLCAHCVHMPSEPTHAHVQYLGWFMHATVHSTNHLPSSEGNPHSKNLVPQPSLVAHLAQFGQHWQTHHPHWAMIFQLREVKAAQK